MHIDGPKGWESEKPGRQDLAVGHHHQGVGGSFHKHLPFFRSQPFRLVDGESVIQCQLLDGTDGQFAATSGGAVGLGEDPPDLVPAREELAEGGYCKAGGPHEEQAHHHSPARTFLRIFLLMMSRLITLR